MTVSDDNAPPELLAMRGVTHDLEIARNGADHAGDKELWADIEAVLTKAWNKRNAMEKAHDPHWGR